MSPDTADLSGFRSGFVTLVGRPNAGKSTLVNRLVGTKVSIVSDRPQTTRTEIRGVRTTSTAQVVLLDTPGVHRPRTPLGERTNARALATLTEVDVICQLVDATAPIGGGDRYIAELVQATSTPSVLVLNKVDAVSPARVAAQLSAAAATLGDHEAFVPLSARTGESVEVLAAELEAALPEGPHYYPDGMVTDQPEAMLVAELVREQLLGMARDELPHSIAVTAVAIDAAGEEVDVRDPEAAARFRVVIRVERESQKGMVIGRGGVVIRDAGTAARLALEALLGIRVHLETVVTVDRQWQRKAHALDRLGF